ncbi:diguanylate cyclase [Marinomonas sp. M1K-6]|uniref:diguanylate cyclase n=1 Tax=Marinomonas profundi TaxID=2726122 RepID=A0A847QYC4_9GAMM|nr:sensor domain-containing diguanylate cyclase [Marinomonas profundi]NLQ19118.1 diguanylate cyclase [Marinomonas profundi]UDV02090.1 diguanylate cyclase [Marinomonas profundi]
MIIKGFNTFRNRITLLTGGLLLSLSLVLITYLYHVATTRLSTASGESLVNISQSISTMLSANLIEREREIILLSKRSSLFKEQDLSDLQEAIDQIKDSYKYYAWIGFANPDGVVLASGNGLLKGADVSQRPWFINGQAGAFIGDVHKALLLERLLPKSQTGTPIRFIDFSAPVMGEDGELKGVVATHADWLWVDDVLSSAFTQVSERKGVDIFIIDNENNVLYPDNDLGDIEVPSALPQENQFQSLVWQDGEDYLTSLVAVNFPESTNLGWKVVVRQPTAIAMADVKEVHRLLLVLGVFSTLLCMWLAYRFASSLSRPLERLAKTARNIQQGNRNVSFQDDSQLKEVTSLSRSLQEMMSSLLDRERTLLQLTVTLEAKVKARTAQLEASNRSLEALARQDPLTKIFNRLALDEALLKEYELAREHNTEFAIIMADADYFKKVNDQYGHTVGDNVLKNIANVMKDIVDSAGMAARFGGEEFTVLLPNTQIEKAQQVAETLREKIASTEMDTGLFVTASFGVAMFKMTDDHYEQVLNRADAALYKAKDRGRNCVVVSD